MDGVDRLNQFNLGAHGDRREREFWPLLADRFPAYEIFWRRFVVPLTNRSDPKFDGPQDEWIRLRPGVPENYEQMSMFQYSVFYFLGRAVKRFGEEQTAMEYPEDVLFLLDSIGDNFENFMRVMNKLGADCGRTVFEASVDQFPKGFEPFNEISAYRDTLLHNAVIGRGVEFEKTYLPKWNADKSVSPLERVKKSWRAVEQLPPDDLISTNDLLGRLIDDACSTLEKSWQKAVVAVTGPPFEDRMMRIAGFAGQPLLQFQVPPESTLSSGSFSSLGSNTTFRVPAASGDCRATIRPGPSEK